MSSTASLDNAYAFSNSSRFVKGRYNRPDEKWCLNETHREGRKLTSVLIPVTNISAGYTIAMAVQRFEFLTDWMWVSKTREEIEL
jgi:hypothetical protein